MAGDRLHALPAAVAVICAFATFIIFLVLRHDNNNAAIAAPPAPHSVIEPFNIQPMEDYTQYFQSYRFDVETPQYVRTYTYFWHAPAAAATPGKKFPLVMVLHGTSGKGYAAKYLISSPVADHHPAFILVPALAEHNAWAVPPEGTQNLPATMGDDYALGDMVRMIKRLTDLYPIDTSRIYIVGCSSGGIGAFAAARYYPDVFAAAVPISGTWNPADAPNMTRVPLWIETGSLDPIMSAATTGDLTQLVAAYKGNVRYTAFPEMGHNCPSDQLYSSVLWNWLFSQKQSVSTAQTH